MGDVPIFSFWIGVISDKKISWKEKAKLKSPSMNLIGIWLTVKEEAVFTRDDRVKYLESKGIQTKMLFAENLIKHPCFDEMRKCGEGYRVVNSPSHPPTRSSSALPVTDRIMRDTFWVGVYPGMRVVSLMDACIVIRAYIAEVLKDGHLSFPAEIKERFHLREGMKITVTIEDVGKVKEEKKEASLQYLFSQEIDFASWKEEKEELIKQRITDIETAGR